jgi:hypothetical protein
MIEVVDSAALEQIRGWYTARGQTPPPADWFGAGLWVPGVAAGFLYVCGARAYLEDVTTNPEADSKARHEALASLGQHLVAAAREAGASYLVGWSREMDVAARAHAMGFVDIGQFRGFALALEV